jgi:polyhydroxybutyrate depolymerase
MRQLWRALAGFVLFALPTPLLACSHSTPCTTALGDYLVRPAKGLATGKKAPVLMFLHGFDSSAEAAMQDEALLRVVDELGAILITPQGLEVRPQRRGWSFPGTLRNGRDEVAFIDGVMEDAMRRWPADPARMLATGFSAGGSMVWYMACFGKTGFAAYVPVAGAFWEPQPVACPAGPRNILHIHGISDQTVPLIGRAIGGPESGIRQGMVMRGMALWQKLDGCNSSVVSAEPLPDMMCRISTARQCSSGKALGLCLHDGEHLARPEWLLPALEWLKDNGG